MGLSITKTASPIDLDLFQAVTIFQAGAGAGAPLVYTVPTGQRIYLLSIDISVAAFNAGPTKVVEIALADTSDTYAKTTIGTGTAAVNAIQVHLAHEIQSLNSTPPPNVNWRPLPFNQILNPGDTITCTIINAGATDQITQGVFRAMQWLEP